jgi:hypothetical protein
MNSSPMCVVGLCSCVQVVMVASVVKVLAKVLVGEVEVQVQVDTWEVDGWEVVDG